MKTKYCILNKIGISTAMLLLVLISFESHSQDYGKSYVNITKGNIGGTVEPGDTLEIRATFVVKSGSYTKCVFTDNVPANTTYVPATLRILTNEGKIYKQLTDKSGDDPGTISGTSITINLGSGANASTGGTIKNTDKPSFFGSTCIMVASYRVVVGPTMLYGTKIAVGGGSLTYKSGSITNIINFPKDSVMLYENISLCNNSVSVNALLSESGGSFGSGNKKDRGISSNVPNNYSYSTFSSTAGMPQDYYYGVSNNTSGGLTSSTGYSISNAWPYPDNSSPSHRIFGVWDIIGDHTNAVNPLLGNPPADVNAGASGGYMLVINSSYKTDIAFRDTVSNLCPNTYYEYTAWIRNICSKCGCDSNGKGANSGPGYIPTGPGDSSGVHPNLTFNINGNDYYTTGNLPYTGQWIKKGFVYKTGPNETSMVIVVRNNAPGGGGNDWAIDDISVSSCLPSIAMLPGKPQYLCMGANDTVRFQINSYFNNYTEWKIEQSFDAGETWSSPGNDTTGAEPTGSAIPVYNPAIGQYQYTITRHYRLDNINKLVMYRIVVASTSENLTNNKCSFVGDSPLIVNAVDCFLILPVNFIYFKGEKDINGNANLKWSTANESPDVKYLVERSDDGINFKSLATINKNQTANPEYLFVDSRPVASSTYYRIKAISKNVEKISPMLFLSNTQFDFAIRSLVNPFRDKISFELLVPMNDKALFSLFDSYGRLIRSQNQMLGQGLNEVVIPNLYDLSAGIYFLKIQFADKIDVRRLMKN